jgi:hypothetical protein
MRFEQAANSASGLLRQLPPASDAGSLGAAARLHRVPSSLELLPAHKALFLAERMVEWLAQPPCGSIMVEAWDTGVWNEPTHGVMASFRRLLGEHRPVDAAPVLIAAPNEMAGVIGYCLMAMCHSWGLVLRSDAGVREVCTDHDGHVWLASAREGDDLTVLDRALKP